MSALENIQKQLQASKRSFSNLTGSIITRTKSVANNASKNISESVSRQNVESDRIWRTKGGPGAMMTPLIPTLAAQKKLPKPIQRFAEKDSGTVVNFAKSIVFGDVKDTRANLETFNKVRKGKPTTSLERKNLERFGEDQMLNIVGSIDAPKVHGEAIKSLVDDVSESALSKYASKIGKRVEPRSSVRKGLDSAYTMWVNAWHPVESYADKIQKASGVNIPVEESVKYNIKKYLGSGGIAKLRHEKELKPILAEVQDIPRDLFEGYLIAKRDLGFEEAGRKIKGVDPDLARRAITEMHETLGVDRVKQLDESINKLYAYQDAGLQKLRDTGFIDDATYEAIKNRNIDYVPYKRVMDKVDEILGISNSVQVSTKPGMLKEIKGSDRLIQSPLESIIADTYKIEALVAKNDFVNSFVKLKDYFDDGTIKVLRSSENVRKRTDIVNTIRAARISSNTIKRAMRVDKARIRVLRSELGQIYSAALRAEKSLDRMSVTKKTSEKLTKMRFKGDDLVGGKIVTDKTREFSYGALKQIVKERDSKKFLYKLMSMPAEDLRVLLTKAGSRGEKIRRIMDEVDALRNTLGDIEQVRGSLRQEARSLSDVSSFDKNTISVWRNGVKEIYQVEPEIEAVVKGLDQESLDIVSRLAGDITGIFRQGQTGRNIDFMLANVIKDQWDAMVNAKYGYVPFLGYMRGLGHLINYDFRGGDRFVEEWLKKGGDQVYRRLASRSSVGEGISEAADSAGIRGMRDSVIKMLDFMGRYSDTPTRLGVAERAYKATGSMAEAVLESREATVDFARMGTKMRVANAFVPFLNPSVQGFDKMLRTLWNNPKRFAFVLAAYGGLPATLVSLYNNAFHGREYAEVPDWERENNFIIMTGENINGKPGYLKVMKGNSIPYVANPVDYFISYLYKNDPQSFQSLFFSMFTGALPVIGDGSNASDVGSRTLGNIIPQPIKPLVEAKSNFDLFKNKPIESISMQFKEPKDRFKASTPWLYKSIGKALDMSPLKVEKILEGYLAGASKTPADILEVISQIKEGEDIDVNIIPVLRRFIGNYEDFEDTPRSTPAKGLRVKKLKPGVRLNPSNGL